MCSRRQRHAKPGQPFIFPVHIGEAGQPERELKGLVEALGRDIRFPERLYKFLPAVQKKGQRAACGFEFREISAVPLCLKAQNIAIKTQQRRVEPAPFFSGFAWPFWAYPS